MDHVSESKIHFKYKEELSVNPSSGKVWFYQDYWVESWDKDDQLLNKDFWDWDFLGNHFIVPLHGQRILQLLLVLKWRHVGTQCAFLSRIVFHQICALMVSESGVVAHHTH